MAGSASSTSSSTFETPDPFWAITPPGSCARNTFFRSNSPIAKREPHRQIAAGTPPHLSGPIPSGNDAEDFSEHCCSDAKVGAGCDEIWLQLRHVRNSGTGRELRQTDPHNGASNVFPHDLDRFLRCLRLRNKDEATSGLRCYGKWIIRSHRLDELLDDRRLQRRVGTFLDQHSIQHASSMVHGVE